MDAIKFHSEISKQFDNYYKDSIFSERISVWINIIDKYLEKDELGLDAGCGTGFFSFYIAQRGNKVIGIDGSKDMIDLCKAKLVKYRNLDVEFLLQKLPFNRRFPSKKFGFVISSSVLEYISEYEVCLSEFWESLKPGGILIISLPNRNSVYRIFEKLIYTLFERPRYFKLVKYMSTVESFNVLMQSKGFEVLENKLYSTNNYLEKFLKLLFIPKKYRSSLFLGVYRKKAVLYN